MPVVMSVLFLLIGVGVVLLAAFLAVGRMGGLPAAAPDRAAVELPVETVSAEAVGRLRFPVVLRGYRMVDVDRALDRLQSELADRDARLALIEGRVGDFDSGHQGYSNDHAVT